MKLTIEKVIYGGQGLARVPEDSGSQSGMRALVPFTLPGEIVEAEIVQQHRGYCVGNVQRIEHVSEFRVTPPCPWFGTCGGCQLQQGAYPYQLEMKREMLAESLTRAGLRDLPSISMLNGAPLAYRNRVRLQVETRPRFAMGYRQAKSHRMVAVDHCPIAGDLLNRCMTAIGALGRANAVPSGMAEIELFTNHDESELLLTVWTSQPPRSKMNFSADFFLKLQKEIPQLSGAMVLAAEKQSSKPWLQWGQQGLQYRVAGREYRVGAGSFFQVNASLLDDFAGCVLGNERGDCAWDFYAGGGFFSLPLTERFRQVLAVESSPSSSRDLRKNLQGTSGTAICSTTLDFLKRATQQKDAAPDLVVLDPPRAGAGVEVCRLLAACNPQRIAYVSCDPATLGRDLATLIQSGYRLQRLQMVDMFPQTGHLETIATLHR